MRPGRIQTRHKPLIRIWRRIFTEAGAHIPDRNVERPLNTTHIRRHEQDTRRMDLITPGIAGVYGGNPFFMDVTCVSPLHGTGEPMPRAHTEDGAATLEAARCNRQRDYPDVESSPHAQLLSLGVETFGRWSPHCLTLVRQLAKAKARRHNPLLHKSLEIAFYRRWWSLLSVTTQRIVTEHIIRPSGADLVAAEETFRPPRLDEVFDYNR